MTYPVKRDYDLLYSKYLDDQLKLLDYAAPNRNDYVLDLCCGAGDIAYECYRLGAEVVAVDRCYNMLSDNIKRLYLKNSDRLSFRESEVTNFFDDTNYRSSKVYCRQAINYWFTRHAITNLARIILPGGVFVFNTFTNRPSEIPTWKSYFVDGKVVSEAYYLVDSFVHHLQMREGIVPHMTKFRWIPEEEFKEVLSDLFSVEMYKPSNTSAIYVCTRKL